MIKKGKTEMIFAKVAPAPIKTNIAGRAQHIRVEDEANKDRKLAGRSNILNFQ